MPHTREFMVIKLFNNEKKQRIAIKADNCSLSFK